MKIDIIIILLGALIVAGVIYGKQKICERYKMDYSIFADSCVVKKGK